MYKSFLALALLLQCSAARANVYATNLRLNGGITNLSIASGGTVNIGYFLNEPATAGLTIEIKSGATTLRTIALTNGSPGTARGTNTVLWDGADNMGHYLGSGTYSVSITSAAKGSNDWFQISDDFNTNNYVWEPRGIAVNKNTNSPYYGRVFVSNSSDGPHPNSNPGDRVGLQKFNADASTAEEGGFSDGGWPWEDNFLSPWKLEVGDDDRLYVSEFWDQGGVFSFDQTISSNSLRQVLRPDNWPNVNVNLNGLLISGSGTNTQVWMADDSATGFGIRRWNAFTNGIVATNDLGSTIIPAGGPSDLTTYPTDVAVDTSNRIYVIQNTIVSGNPVHRVLRFPASGGTTADWKIGSGNDDLRNAFGIAVDPTGRYVAVAFHGVTNNVETPGSVRVFNASDGTPVTTQTADGGQAATDVAWDNAGNLYATDNAASLWRVYSPPGSNQATTVALPSITVIGSSVQPVLSELSYSAGKYHFILTGEANVTYIILGSTDLQTWVAVATNTSVFATREITITAPANQTYYRAFVGPYSPAPPFLSAPAYATGQFQLTLLGEANLTYVIQSSPDCQSWVSVATNNAPTASRSITIPAAASRSFYRAFVRIP